MRYRFSDIAQHPQLIQKVLEVGKFTASREFVELPDNFDFQGITIEPVQEMIGFGDLIAGIAKPIARGIDTIAGTDIQNCGGCQQRQDWLNEHLPFP